MKTIFEQDNDLIPKVATIGFFDGVHLGHDYLLRMLKNVAESKKLQSMVVTFSNHPRLFFQPDCGLKQLTLCDEKIRIIENKGIDYALILNFSDELSKLTSFEFLKMLSENYGVKTLLIGYDHHFGSDKNASFENYEEYGKSLNIEVIRCVQHLEHDLVVSSSKVRKALDFWNVSLANDLLGYRYSVSGRVVHGKQLGRQLGFPTANLDVNPLKILPAQGVYSVKVLIPSKKVYYGIVNIGNRPTVNGENRTVEVYIIGFSGDLYGEMLTIEFLKFIRHEQKFQDLDKLKQQIQKDVDSIK